MKRPRTIEDICIHKIQQGIRSLSTGKRSAEECEADLEFSFMKLKELNNNMFEELQMKYLLERIKKEKEIKECV
jgi:hypothetical protein